MKIERVLCLLCLMILSLVACNPAGEEPIRPGDEVGGFLVTTGEPDGIADRFFRFDEQCERDEDQVACTAVAGTPFHITYAFYGNTAADLDARWSAASYEIYLEDRPLDLESFGSVDFRHAETGWPMRAWNVVVEAAEPAVLVIRHVGEVGGESFDDTVTLTFEAASSD